MAIIVPNVPYFIRHKTINESRKYIETSHNPIDIILNTPQY